VFYARQDTKATEPDTFVIRVRNVSASAAQTAAQGVSSAAQTAAVGIGKGAKQGVYVTRVWAAPRLESAAEHTTKTVAPKVSSALKASAQQIRPEEVAQKKSRSMLTWSLLAAAMLATAGAVAALVRHRYNAVMAEDEDEDFGGPEGAAAGTEGAAPGESATTSADAGVNGRVSTPGW